MKLWFSAFAGVLLISAGFSETFAAEASLLKDQVKLQVLSVGLMPGMPQGFYICGEGHLHIRATVQNNSSAPMGKVTVAGKVYDANGGLLGEAKASTRQATLLPYETTEVNLEFLTVTGPKIQQVARNEEIVVDASPAR